MPKCFQRLEINPEIDVPPSTIAIAVGVAMGLIVTSFSFSWLQATESFRTTLVGADEIFSAADMPFNMSNTTAANQIIQGSVAIAIAIMAIANRLATLIIFAMRRFIGEAFGKYKDNELKGYLQAYMRIGLVFSLVMMSGEMFVLAYGANILLPKICNDPRQAALASISLNNIAPGGMFLILRILLEIFTLQRSISMIALVAGICLTTFIIGSVASVLLGEIYGLAGLSWGFDSEAILTLLAMTALIVCHPEFNHYQLLHLHLMNCGEHWKEVLKIFRFALIKFVSAIHEVAIPLILVLIAANDSATTVANFNAALQHYSFMRPFSLAFAGALYTYVPRLKGVFLATYVLDSNKQLTILANIQRFIVYGLSTVMGVSIPVAIGIYFLIKTFTPDLTVDGNYLLSYYAGVGLLNAFNTNAGALLSMTNTPLNRYNMWVSGMFSWGALGLFVGFYYAKIIDFKQAGPIFVIMEFIKSLLLSIPLTGLQNNTILQTAIEKGNEPIAIGESFLRVWGSSKSRDDNNLSTTRIIDNLLPTPLNGTMGEYGSLSLF